ncbi:MAG: sulfatase [Phycisphaerae bacterium]|nr:sulfatase [Phycisphaerae bacterium]
MTPFKLPRLSLMCFFCMLAGAALAAPTTQPDRPNILWIVSDDHAAYVTGCYGNPLAHTPNIDRLAARGIRFDRAYCNSPMCTPSRGSFLTGRYPRATGVMCLRDALPEGQLTLADHLRGFGYRTGAFGKMHFNSELKHGFETHVRIQDWQAHLRHHPPEPIPNDIDVLPVWRPFRDPARVWLNSFCRPYGLRAADMAGTFYVDHAIEFIKAHRREPFFVVVGFQEPHSPFWFPIEYRNRIDPATMPIPEVGPEDAEQIPAIFRDLMPAEKQGIAAAAYTSTAFMDSNVGRLTDAIEQLGLTDNTLIIYMGDNGYHLGHHGRFEKHSFYEGAVRCPLVMAGPGRIAPGSSTRSLVEFVDLMPTILDLVAVPRPKDVRLHGHSLAGVLANPTTEVRDAAFSEYAHSEEAMVRTADWKLIYHTGKRERDDGYTTGRPLPGRNIRLYDERNDPDEMTNLADRPEHRERVKQLTARLHAHLVATEPDPKAIPAPATPEAVIDWCLTRHAERATASSRPRQAR